MDKNVISLINNGGVGVMPTDTIYGIVCAANNQEAVDKIYKLKSRDAHKPVIVLAANVSQIKECGVSIDSQTWSTLDSQWRSSPSSIILPADATLEHVHRGLNTIAVRIPYSNKELMELLLATGAIVATSVNVSGTPPLHNLYEIKREFPDLDFYVDGQSGERPSELYIMNNGSLQSIQR